MDFIYNGQAVGNVAATLLNNNFDVGLLRPYQVQENGPVYVSRFTGNSAEGKPQYSPVPIHNANSTLLIREWIELDNRIVKTALPRLRAVRDLRTRGLVYNLPNGMSKTVLQSQTQSDISPAGISMDPIVDIKGDRPVYDSTLLPLPVIHKDFSFSARQIAISRNGSMPLDMSMAELAARKVAEGAEQLLLGVSAVTYAYGGGTIYGYTSHPNRITYTLTNPTLTAWVPRTLVAQIIAMRSAAQAKFHYGPYVLYTSLFWDAYLDEDLNTDSANASNITLRQRIKNIEGIEDVVTLDYLNGWDMLLVQMTSDVVEEVVGMDITTVQWESKGGLEMNFKVMAILVPKLKADANSNMGIVHGHVASGTGYNTTIRAANTYLPYGSR